MKKSRRLTTYGANYARTKFSFIIGTKKQRIAAYQQVKTELDFPDLCNTVDYLEQSMPEKYKELIFGKALPTSYEEMGNITEHPKLHDSIIGEINWTLISIRKYKNEISLFLTYKEIFERHLLLGNYEEAEIILSKVESEICYSLYTLEQRFLLKELSGEPSENKALLSTFNDENKSIWLTKGVAHYLSLRAEKSLSYNRYHSDLENGIKSLKNTTVKNSYLNYYRFKLAFLKHEDYESYSDILVLDFENSIIDRYLIFTKVLTNLLVVSTFLENDKNSKEIRKYLQSRIDYTIRKVPDPVLIKLKLIASTDLFPTFQVNEARKEIDVIDKYTTGLYGEVESDLISILHDKPGQFDLYVLYVKSLIYQQKKFSPIGNLKSLQNEILNDMYKILSVKSNPSQAGLNLLRISNNISNTSISYGLVDFVMTETKGKQTRSLISKICYNSANPIMADIYSDSSVKKKYLNLLLSKYPESITIQFFLEKLKGIDNLLRFKQKIPEGKFRSEFARNLQRLERYEEAANEWEHLIKNYSDTIPIYELAIRNLFICYENLNYIDNCISIYVNSYFVNNFIVDKIETDTLLKKINKHRFRNVTKSIELPIFYTLVEADEIETHIAFELFNSTLNVEKPSQIIQISDNFERQKILYYFREVCSPKVLMHSTHIENSKERLEERLSILQFVKTMDDGNKLIEAEIKSIQNILVIQQGLIDLDESKIYVNEQGILDNELQDYEAVFERFKNIYGISGKNKLLFLKGGKLTTLDFSDEHAIEEKIEYSSNPVLEIYLELFEAIKNKFLHSQFGIVAYLSTRIRHGVLIGELRPIFEKHNLITLKEGNTSNYRVNQHWNRVFNTLSFQLQHQIQVFLSEFSSKVDGLIFDLIKKHLQVFDAESNPDGWFNYELTSEELWLDSIMSVNATDYNHFVQDVFKVLWKRTDANLANIREKIQTDILNNINEVLNDLERNLTSLLGYQNSQPIIKDIKNCSTEVQTVIQKISRWFKRSEIKASDFDLGDLIEIIMEYTNKSNSRKKLILSKDLTYNPKIKGEFKTHFADVLRIFIENILKHSAEEAQAIPCRISSAITDNGELHLSILNKVTNKATVELLKNSWKGNKIDTSKLLSEGKSGYHKAFKTLTSDLKSDKSNCLNTNVNDEDETFEVNLTINLNELAA